VKTSTLIIGAFLLVPQMGNSLSFGSSTQPYQRAFKTIALTEALPQELLSEVTNAPNPFDSRKGGLEGQTVISYQLKLDAKTSITIYDLLGNRVRSWEALPGQIGGRKGHNEIPWDGTNDRGQKVSKGGYMAQIVVETPTTIVTAIRKIGVIH